MIKSMIGSTVCIFLLIACARKAMPTIPERERELPVKETTRTDVQPDASRGKVIFMNRCARCHDLPSPAQYSFERWEAILKSMIPRARLNEEQGIHVTAYVKENSK